MKKMITGMVGLILVVASSASTAAMSYECWAYIGGSPNKMIYVTASNKSQAISTAKEKMNKLKIKYNYIKCK